MKQIEVTLDEKDRFSFQTRCACGDTHHELDVYIHTIIDHDALGLPDNKITITEMSVTLCTPFINYCDDGWFKRFKDKVIAIFKIIFDKPIEWYLDFSFRDKQHLESFIEGLQYGLNKFKGTP